MVCCILILSLQKLLESVGQLVPPLNYDGLLLRSFSQSMIGSHLVYTIPVVTVMYMYVVTCIIVNIIVELIDRMVKRKTVVLYIIDCNRLQPTKHNLRKAISKLEKILREYNYTPLEKGMASYTLPAESIHRQALINSGNTHFTLISSLHFSHSMQH